jgi:hypothetical protein
MARIDEKVLALSTMALFSGCTKKETAPAELTATRWTQ